jgi:putative pre-16S rRNA nuclease
MAAMSVPVARNSEHIPERAAFSEPSARILAIDYGRRRIGLAISDELGLTAQPHAVLVRKNRQDDLKRLREICSRNAIGHIIVGYPVHITGEAGEMAAEASQFAARLAKALAIKTEMIDERLTSWEARQTLAETGTRAKRSPIDDVAAAILLREYLALRRERSRSSRTERD